MIVVMSSVWFHTTNPPYFVVQLCDQYMDDENSRPYVSYDVPEVLSCLLRVPGKCVINH